MSGDVQQTLNELERKLRELQAELRAPAAEPPRVEEPPPSEPARVEEPPPPPPPPPAPPSRNPLQDQLDELLRFRDQLTEAANRLVEDYTRLVEQLERVAQAPAPPTPAAGHLTFPVPPPAPPSTEGTLFSGQVVVEAAPFDDIGVLAAFESALRSIAQAEEVHVRSFDGGRAIFEVRLGGEAALVFELRRASDQGFDVEHAEPGRLELAMHPPGDLPFPMRP
jgi:hypothetical protein